MNTHLAAIVSFILLYGYAVILPVAIVEGPIITVIAGFLAAQGYFNVYIVYLVVIIGDLLGDLLYYIIGRFGRRIAHGKFGRKIGIKETQLVSLKEHFDEHSGKTLLLGKWTHSLGLVTLTGAGASGMRVGKFLWYSLLGTLPKSLVFLLVGYYIGYAYERIDTYISKGSFILAIVLIVTLASYWFWKRSKKPKDL